MGIGGIIKANRVMSTPEQEALKHYILPVADDVTFKPLIEVELRKRLEIYKDTARRLKGDIPKDGLTLIDAYNKGMLYELDQVIADLEQLLN